MLHPKLILHLHLVKRNVRSSFSKIYRCFEFLDVFLLGIITVLPVAHSAPPLQVRSGLSIVIVDHVQMMSQPSEESEAVSPLKKGDRITVDKQLVKMEKETWVFATAFIYCSSSDLCKGWVKAEQIAHKSFFKRLNRWNGPKKIDLEMGDYSGTYTFTTLGSFVHAHSGNDGSDIDRGHLYQSGAVIWARVPRDDEFGDIFIMLDASTLCWHVDLSMCASERKAQ